MMGKDREADRDGRTIGRLGLQGQVGGTDGLLTNVSKGWMINGLPLLLRRLLLLPPSLLLLLH